MRRSRRTTQPARFVIENPHRNYSLTTSVSPLIQAEFAAVSEGAEAFLKRLAVVQEMIVKVIILADKRGRPSKELENYGQAA